MHRRTWTLAVVALMAFFVGKVTFFTPLWHPPAHAETASSSDDTIIVTGNYKAGAAGLIWMIHSPSRRLLVYERSNGKLILGAARNIDGDLQLHEYPAGKQIPTVKEVRDATAGRPNPPTGSGKIIAVTGRNIGGTRDLLYVYDTLGQTLAIYDYNARHLTLVAVRLVRHDLKINEWIEGEHTPSVRRVRGC